MQCPVTPRIHSGHAEGWTAPGSALRVAVAPNVLTGSPHEHEPPVVSTLFGVVRGLGGLKQRPQDVHDPEAEAEDEHNSECDGDETDKGQRHGIGCVREKVLASVV